VPTTVNSSAKSSTGNILRRGSHLGDGVKLFEFLHFAALPVAAAAFSAQVAVEAQQHEEARSSAKALCGLRGGDVFVVTNRYLSIVYDDRRGRRLRKKTCK